MRLNVLSEHYSYLAEERDSLHVGVLVQKGRGAHQDAWGRTIGRVRVLIRGTVHRRS